MALPVALRARLVRLLEAVENVGLEALRHAFAVARERIAQGILDDLQHVIRID